MQKSPTGLFVLSVFDRKLECFDCFGWAAVSLLAIKWSATNRVHLGRHKLQLPRCPMLTDGKVGGYKALGGGHGLG